MNPFITGAVRIFQAGSRTREPIVSGSLMPANGLRRVSILDDYSRTTSCGFLSSRKATNFEWRR